MRLDQDLQSIQEVRNLVAQAKRAAEILASFSQEQLDQICMAITDACLEHLEELAEMAVEETGFGCREDKILKNWLGSKGTWEWMKGKKVVGLLKEDQENRIMEIGVPVGVIAALIPSTNPTSTTMYKSLISIKAGNAIVISPHPGARKCILKTCEVIQRAVGQAGAPEGTVSAISIPLSESVDALLKHRDVNMILATGGEAMVHAAYSSGNPALGVGPGNGPSYIEGTADIPGAVRRILESKTFDNGTICASEQSIVTETAIKEEVEQELERQGGYFLSEEESARLSGLLLRANGTMNPKVVGKTACQIAEMAGISLPNSVRLLISRQKREDIHRRNPYAREKLCPVLGFFTGKDRKEACQICMGILQNEGMGHTMTIHTQDERVVREFALQKPVSRILVNTPGALGGVGATTGLAPALTLGCGAAGGSATSDNITPYHLINIRRAAYGICESVELRQKIGLEGKQEITSGKHLGDGESEVLTEADIEAITKAVLARLGKKQ